VRDVGLWAWAVQDGFDPLETLESVEIRYHQYYQCHKLISTPESIGELKNWRNALLRYSNIYLDETDAASLKTLVLPRHGTKFKTPPIDQDIKNQDLEREYRRKVVAQQTAVTNTVKWQADTLPVGNLLSPSSINLTLEGRTRASSAICRGGQVILKCTLHLL
jgi:hypothetical protein